MSSAFIAAAVEALIPLVGGLICTLYGFRLIGPKPGQNPKQDEWHAKWGRHMKWLGPVVIAFAIVLFAMNLNRPSR